MLEVAAILPARVGEKLKPDRLAVNFVRTFAPDNFALELALTNRDRSYQYFAYDDQEGEWWSGVEYFEPEVEGARRSNALQILAERSKDAPLPTLADPAQLRFVVKQIDDSADQRLTDELETFRYQLNHYFGISAQERTAYKLLLGEALEEGEEFEDFPGNLVSRFLTRCRLLLDLETETQQRNRSAPISAKKLSFPLYIRYNYIICCCLTDGKLLVPGARALN